MSNLKNNSGRVRYRVFDAQTERDAARQIWLALSEKTPHNYFNSWGWISTWLASLPVDREVKLVTAFQEDEPVAAFFAGRTRRLRCGLIPSNILALNATGSPYFDKIYIEHNRVLVCPSFTPNWAELWDSAGAWDEFILPGLASDFAQAVGLHSGMVGGFHVITDQIENCHWVDLQQVRDVNMDYLSLLSSNRRGQIRRSLREYEREGSLTLREADNLSEALMMYSGLIELHQHEWTKRGKKGAFANEYLTAFHERLIRERFESGEIQLLQVNAGARVLGYLYCFVYQGNVLYYQSGFDYGEGNVQRPGLVSHYLGILHNASKGFDVYDFLAGDMQYKNSLATHSAPMLWMRLIRGGVRLQFERAVLAVRKRTRPGLGAFELLKSFGNLLKTR